LGVLAFRIQELRNRRAVSLLEAVIAVFILLGVLTFTLEIYSRSMGYLGAIERNAQAANFANNVLNEVRQWAKEPENFLLDDWAPFASFKDSSFPDLEARVTADFSTTMSPSSAQEIDRPSGRQVRMEGSLKTVSINILRDGEDLFQVTAVLSEPKREIDIASAVVVTPVGPLAGPLAADETQRFRAKFIDANGDEVKDVKFSWSVEPNTGNAHISEQSRDGEEGTLMNAYILRPNTRIYTGGTCRVSASATYFGEDYSGLSGSVELATP
jgi:type II secretory pathway pseudopilin PulG